MTSSGFFSRIMNSLDVFASKVQLTIFQRQQNSSLLSRALTFIVGLATIIILKDDLYNSISQSKPQVLNTQQSQQEPPVIIPLKYINIYQQIYKIEPQNFTYAFLVATDQMKTLHGIDKYFQFTLTVCHRRRHELGTPTVNCTIIPLEECSLYKHFQSKTQYEYFKLYNFTGMRCINYEWWTQNQLLIGGTSYSKDYYYLNLQVKVCRNSTNMQKCSPKEEIDKKLQGAFFMSYISTNQVDHSLKGNPYIFNIKGKYISISQMFLKTQTITYSAYKTLTDIGYVSNQNKEDNAILITDTQEFTDQIPQNLLMLNQVILLDDVQQVALRQYSKLSQIMGQIGGLYSVLYQIVSVLGSPFILAGLKLDLLDWISKNESKDQNFQQNQILPQNIFKRKYNQILNICKIITKVKIENQSNLDLILKLMDINYLIEKILEIDKLKYIIFNEEQYTCFNQLPLINEHIKQLNLKSLSTKHTFYSKERFRNFGEHIQQFVQIQKEKAESFTDDIKEGQIQQVFSQKRVGTRGINASQRTLQNQIFGSILSPMQQKNESELQLFQSYQKENEGQC